MFVITVYANTWYMYYHKYYGLNFCVCIVLPCIQVNKEIAATAS